MNENHAWIKKMNPYQIGSWTEERKTTGQKTKGGANPGKIVKEKIFKVFPMKWERRLTLSILGNESGEKDAAKKDWQ